MQRTVAEVLRSQRNRKKIFGDKTKFETLVTEGPKSFWKKFKEYAKMVIADDSIAR